MKKSIPPGPSINYHGYTFYTNDLLAGYHLIDQVKATGKASGEIEHNDELIKWELQKLPFIVRMLKWFGLN